MSNVFESMLTRQGAQLAGGRIRDFGDALAEVRAAAAQTVACPLLHLGLIAFVGTDARAFLHNQLSCDVNALQPGTSTYGSYNTSKGRMLATFLLWSTNDGYRMQLPRELVEPIRKRLGMFILRSKVKTADASEQYALIGIGGSGAADIVAAACGGIPVKEHEVLAIGEATVVRLPGNRFEIAVPQDKAAMYWKVVTRVARPAGHQAWDWLDVRAGIPTITPATQDQFVPQMANLDLIGGVSFSKGCYPGQEIVARMKYLGKLKQRMYLAHLGTEAIPQPGDKLYAADLGNQATGTIVSVAPAPTGGYDVLAVIHVASIATQAVRWQSLQGPPLAFLSLPYKV